MTERAIIDLAVKLDEWEGEWEHAEGIKPGRCFWLAERVLTHLHTDPMPRPVRVTVPVAEVPRV